MISLIVIARKYNSIKRENSAYAVSRREERAGEDRRARATGGGGKRSR